jgi:DNA-binding transcriptional LysR family regulator
VLRLGVAETIVHTWLSRLVKSVNTDYPNLSLEIEVDITPNLNARLLAQEIELAFVLGPLSGPSVRNRVLCDYPVSLVASPSLGLGKGPFSLKELAKFPIITFARKTQPYETVRSLFNRPDLPPIRLHASASLATVIHMAIEGLGIAVMPAAIVENELADRRLRELKTDFTLQPLTFYAAWLASPEEIAVERVADLATRIAQGSAAIAEGSDVDAPRRARH